MAGDLVPRRDEQAPAYRFRFGLAYLLLAVVVGVALGTTFVLMDRGGAREAAAWSPWQPAAEEDGTRIQQIVDYVEARYRLDAERQLLAVIPGLPSIQNGDQRISIRGVAVRAPVARSIEDFDFIDTGNGLMYILCGGATGCSMAGEASQARGRLVRREALELALYTFKYVDQVESVLAFWPPRAGSQATHALFFQKSDFKNELERPLYETLAPVARIDPPSLGTVEGTLVDKLTLPRFFRAQPIQAQDGSAVLVLDPAVLGS